jgi:hypothetical protein
MWILGATRAIFSPSELERRDLKMRNDTYPGIYFYFGCI